VPDPVYFPIPKITRLVQTTKDIASLMTTIFKYKVWTGSMKVDINPAIQWKRDVLEMIIRIFQKVVSHTIVPDQFLYVAQELVLIYFEAAREKETPIWGDWLETLDTLRDCKNGLKPLGISTEGHLVKEIQHVNILQILTIRRMHINV
jgi:hypothetical protein